MEFKTDKAKNLHCFTNILWGVREGGGGQAKLTNSAVKILETKVV